MIKTLVFDHHDLHTSLGMAVRNLKRAEEVAVDSDRDRLIAFNEALQSEMKTRSEDALSLAASMSSLEYELQHLRRSTITEMLGYLEFFLHQLHVRTRLLLSNENAPQWRFAKISEAKERFRTDFDLTTPFESKQWSVIEAVAKSRNCMVHAAGFVDREFNADERCRLRSAGVSFVSARERVRGNKETDDLETFDVSKGAATLLQNRTNEFIGALILSFDEPETSVWYKAPADLVDEDFRKKFSNLQVVEPCLGNEPHYFESRP